MRLLRFAVEGALLFDGGIAFLDLMATDRVGKQFRSEMTEDVTKIGKTGSVYSLNVVGLTGVNASGKTTLLNLLRFVLAQLAGDYDMREFALPQRRLGKLDEEIAIEAVFWHEGNFYLIESRLTRRPNDWPSAFPEAGDSFAYIDETIWVLSARRVNRAMLADSEEFKANATVVLKRNDDSSMPDMARRFLNDKTSIATFITNKVTVSVESPERALPAITMPVEVVQAFDGSVEKLVWDSDSQVFHLKFKNEPERIVGMDAAVAMLSRGTVYGAELVDHAIETLRRGGYLIIDEIEESLNRSLVAVVVDLFASPVTNPRGAQLVFSTHYPELLDSVRRKDAVYVLVRNERWHTQVVKYADCVNRIENKKSAVINNNVIRGSMPRYPDVQAMRDYVRERVNG